MNSSRHTVKLAALTLAVSAWALPGTALATNYSCVTQAYKDATLSFTVAGRIQKIFHREGDRVTKGTPIMALDNRAANLEVERRKLVYEDKSELEADKKEAETYSKMLDSTRKLFKSTGSVSREDLAKLELKAGTAQSHYEQQQIAEKREKVEYELALDNLSQRTLTAPFSGTIVDIKREEGEISEANQPMVQLVDIKKGYLMCNIEEPVGRKLTNGEQVPISIQTGHSQWTGKGNVVFVAPVVDPASGLLRVKIEFDNKSGEVRPGVPGTVTLGPSSDAQATPGANDATPSSDQDP